MIFPGPQDAYYAAKGDLERTLALVGDPSWKDLIPIYGQVDLQGKINLLQPFHDEEERIVAAYNDGVQLEDDRAILVAAQRMANLAQSAAQSLRGIADPPRYQVDDGHGGSYDLATNAPLGMKAPSAALSLDQELADQAAKVGGGLALGGAALGGLVAAVALLYLLVILPRRG